MNKLLLALAGSAALAAVAAPANATIEIFVGDAGALQPDEEVQFNEDGFGDDGNPLYGITNNSNTSVTFLGMEDLTAPSGGQARVEALAAGGFDYLQIFLTDPNLAFKEIEFNINPLQTTGPFQSFDIVVDFTDNLGNVFSQSSTIDNGANWWSARAIDNQWIKQVTLSTAPNNVQAVQQVRIGGIGTPGVVPEPESWALMIAGFGFIGLAMRRRSTLVRMSN